MLRALGLMLTLLMPVAGQAACLNRASLDSGILFDRADGSRGLVVALGEGRVRIDYALGRADRVEVVEADWGIYTRTALQWSGPAGTPAPPERSRRRSGAPGRRPNPPPGRSGKPG